MVNSVEYLNDPHIVGFLFFVAVVSSQEENQRPTRRNNL